MSGPPARDPFARLRQATPARIGLGRSGDGLPTSALLAFQAAASMARDAVHAELDLAALRAALAPEEAIVVASRARDRAEYLARPDLGRALGAGAGALAARRGDYDLAVVIADGLSAQAAQAHAAPLWRAVRARLPGWSLAPPVLATQARVALGDAVAAQLGARMVAVLIGERPGLSVADSLGVYLTWAPRPDTPDASRNCISNIHAGGLSHARAAALLAELAGEARRLGLTGTALKAGAAVLDPPGDAPAPLPDPATATETPPR